MATDLTGLQRSFNLDQCLSFFETKPCPNQTSISNLQPRGDDKLKLCRTDGLELNRKDKRKLCADSNPLALKRSNPGLDLCRSDAVVWCRTCRYKNPKHVQICVECGDPLHGEIDPTGADDQVEGLIRGTDMFTGLFNFTPSLE